MTTCQPVVNHLFLTAYTKPITPSDVLWLACGCQIQTYSKANLAMVFQGGAYVFIIMCTQLLASYPGLLALAFVACSTNAGEGLVKLSHVVLCTWTCGGVAHSWKNSK